MRKTIILLLLAIPLCILFAEESPAELELNFMVQWFPQSQFAGYIAAVEEGYFEQEGLDVNLMFSNGTQSPLQLLENEEIDVCTAWLSQAMQFKAEGADIVHIQQVLQKSSLLLIALSESGIESPADMNGKRISMWGNDFSLLPNAFMAANNIQAEIIPQAYTIEILLSGACDLSLAMYYNEYYQLMLAGKNPDELNTFFFADYGLNFPEDGVYTKTEVMENYPEEMDKFRNAIHKGWQFAADNPQKTLDYVMKYCNEFRMQTNRAQQKWMLNAILASITAEGEIAPEDWGKLSKKDYDMVGNELLRQKMISNIPVFDEFVKGKK